MNKIMKKDGFTLIELMIVVVIIGILASIAIPQFLRYQLKSKTSEAPRNIGAIRVNEEAFSAKWGNYVSASRTPSANPTSLKQSFTAATTSGFYTMGFQPAGAVFYQYAAGATFTANPVETTIDTAGVVQNGILPSPAVNLIIHARGDLDNDTVIGLFFATDENNNVSGFPATSGESVF